MTPEEKIELAELLEYRSRNDWEIRRDRLVAAEMRLGISENGKFTGKGPAELIGDARHPSPGRHSRVTYPNHPFCFRGRSVRIHNQSGDYGSRLAFRTEPTRAERQVNRLKEALKRRQTRVCV